MGVEGDDWKEEQMDTECIPSECISIIPGLCSGFLFAWQAGTGGNPRSNYGA